MPKEACEEKLIIRAQRAIILHRFKQGLALLSDLLANSVNPSTLKSALLSRGNCLLGLGRFEESCADYRKLIDFDEALGCQTLANALSKNNEWGKAIPYYTRAIEAWKKKSYSKNAVSFQLFFRGICHEQIGDKPAAAADFQGYLLGMAEYQRESNIEVFDHLATGKLKLMEPGRNLREELCSAEEVRLGGQMAFVATAADLQSMKKVIANVESGHVAALINAGLHEYSQGRYKQAVAKWAETGIRFDLLVKHARKRGREG